MTDLAASSRRLLAAHGRGKAERVPILSPIRWQPHEDVDARSFGDWRDEENFRKVARLVQEHCDHFPPFNGPGYPRVRQPVSYQRFLEAPMEHVEELPPERIGEKRTRRTMVLHSPKGDLRYVYDRDDGVFTDWDMQKPIGSPEDVEKMLSVPCRFDPPAAGEYEAFRRYRAEAGEECIGGGGVNSMVAMLCAMMPYGLLLEWVLTEPTLIKLLAEEWLKRSWQAVDFLLEQGVGPFWHFNGVERASPPMMGPGQWAELVVPYDGEIMRRIKERAPESIIHVHCHGKVGTLLDSFIDMGVDSLDPLEPPPQGDIGMGEAKRRAAGRLTLFGNIEFLDLETKAPDEVEELVRRAIEDGGRERTVLMPSATPHERHSGRFTENAIRYIEAGLKYGEL